MRSAKSARSGRPSRPPRRFNFVSFPLLVLTAAVVYVAVKFVPIFPLYWKAKTVVADTANHLVYTSRRKGLAKRLPKVEQELKTATIQRLRVLGVQDPDLEVVFARSPAEVAVTAHYTVEIHHYGVIKPTRLAFHPTTRVKR